jgi:hypothetical protein
MRSPWAWLLLQRAPRWSDTIAEVDFATGRLVLPVPWWRKVLGKFLATWARLRRSAR